MNDRTIKVFAIIDNGKFINVPFEIAIDSKERAEAFDYNPYDMVLEALSIHAAGEFDIELVKAIVIDDPHDVGFKVATRGEDF